MAKDVAVLSMSYRERQRCELIWQSSSYTLSLQLTPRLVKGLSPSRSFNESRSTSSDTASSPERKRHPLEGEAYGPTQFPLNS
jgi:hypothetical protein